MHWKGERESARERERARLQPRRSADASGGDVPDTDGDGATTINVIEFHPKNGGGGKGLGAT